MLTDTQYLEDLRERVIDAIRNECRETFDTFDADKVMFHETVSRRNNVVVSVDVTGIVTTDSGKKLKHNICLSFTRINLNKSHNIRRNKS